MKDLPSGLLGILVDAKFETDTRHAALRIKALRARAVVERGDGALLGLLGPDSLLGSRTGAEASALAAFGAKVVGAMVAFALELSVVGSNHHDGVLGFEVVNEAAFGVTADLALGTLAAVLLLA